LITAAVRVSLNIGSLQPALLFATEAVVAQPIPEFSENDLWRPPAVACKGAKSNAAS